MSRSSQARVPIAGDAAAEAAAAGRYSAQATSTHTTGELRWLADVYEQAQRRRIETGERIRAVLQGRDPKWGVLLPSEGDPDEWLRRIRRGETTAPVPLLARAYQRYWEE